MTLTLPEIALAAAAVASLAVWIAIRARPQQALACAPRRRVPWGGNETLLLVGLYFAGMIAAHPLVERVGGIAAQAGQGTDDAAHPVLRLLRDSPGPGTALLCLFSVVIVAPLVEEFFFRVALQGWLEAEEARQRRELPLLRRLSRGALPVLLVALMFSALHWRESSEQVDPRYLRAVLLVSGLTNLTGLALGVCVLRIGVRATWADLGWNAAESWADVRRGLVTFLAVAAPAYLIQFAAKFVCGDRFSPDPAGLFLFALAMGWLYFRTHRILPSLVLHALLNGSSLALLLAG